MQWDPRVLRDRVETTSSPYIDIAAWERHKVIEAAERATTKLVAAQMAAMRTGTEDTI